MEAMEAVLRNFKQIPCPDGDQCTTPSCQWQHSWDRNPPAASSSASPAPVTKQHETLTQDPVGPRKRRRTSSEAGSATAITTATGAVSPPPLKRKAPEHSTLPAPASKVQRPVATAPASLTTPSRATVSISASPSTVSKQSAAKQITAPKQQATPRKPETLNPRHLTSAAPASHEFRFKALKMLHEQFKRLNDEVKKDAKEDEQKLVLTEQELIWLALDVEQKMATEKPVIYTNVIKNEIMAYRKKTPGRWRDERLAEWQKNNEPKTPVKKLRLGPPKEVKTGLTPQEEVSFLVHLLTPITELAEHGYVVRPPTYEEIRRAREGEEASLGWEVCDRCTTRFQVFPGRREEDGALTSGGTCTHHSGRAYFPERVPGTVDRPPKRYRCCQETVGESTGCTVGSTHVFKASAPSRLAALMPFMETPPNPSVPKDRAVCFDCEMGYTARGLELIRLTATSWPNGKELLDVIVRPIGEVLDLNSRYSGVWPEDIANAEEWSPGKPLTTVVESSDTGRTKKKHMTIVPSPMVARDLLFSLICPETPLIGHALENDLNAVRIVHPTIIDTALLFPHRRGLPMRYSLKMLMETELNKAIQVDTKENRGHDSGEDARAAGELVRLKVMEKWDQMKGEGWMVVDGAFVPPGWGKTNIKGGALSERFLEKKEEGELGEEDEVEPVVLDGSGTGGKLYSL
ncbi:RNA exonuclease 3 [Podospora pseudocomata]|uniref:RNA exonuclease 3 n=1 Tax=Podospora pseudocomata TaxID=2093779 RepID=A0ABR0GP26_9PEZI|nr:RNA exonuclease 3 [Podospora pseudocomata]